MNIGKLILKSIIYTIDWFDYADTSTIVGWSSFLTKKILVIKLGRFIFVNVDLYGTSNSVTITMTVPYQAVSTVVGFQAICTSSYDNSTLRTLKDVSNLPAGGSTVSVYKDNLTNAWTASGNKGVTFNFWYISAT